MKGPDEDAGPRLTTRFGALLRRSGVPPWFGVAAAVALLLRALLFRQYLGSPFLRGPAGDELNYWLWAGRIAAGHWAPEGVFWQGPLFPYFIAALKSVVPSFGPPSLAALQLFMNWLACLLLLPLSRRFSGERTALAASALALFFAPGAYFALKGANTTLGLLLLTGGLALLPSGRTGGTWRALAAGAITALAAVAVPAFTLAVGAAGLYLLVRPPPGDPGRRGAVPRLRPAAAFLLGAALAILPVALSNYLQDGSFVPLSADSGGVFLQGNNPDGDGTFTQIPGVSTLVADERQDEEEIARREAGRFLNAGEVSRHFFRKGLSFILSQPLRWLLLEGRKAVLLGSGLDVPHEFHLARERRDFLPTLWLFPVGGTLVLLLASQGLLAPGARKEMLLPLLVSLALAGTGLAFYVGNRYSYPAQFFLMPTAAAGLLELPRLRRSPVRAAAFLPVVFMALLAAGWLRDRGDEARDYLPKLAYAYQDSGELPMAARILERMVRAAPDDPAVFKFAANAYELHDDPEYALRLYERALELDPGDPEAAYRRAGLLYAVGRKEEALAALDRLLERAPGYSQARLGRIRLLEGLGRSADVEADWRAGLSLDPYSSTLRASYAEWLYRRGRPAEAAGEFAKARILDPRLISPPWSAGR